MFGLEYRDCWIRKLDKDYEAVATTIDVVYLVLRLTSILSFLTLMMVTSMLAQQKKGEAVGRAVFLIMMICLSISIIVVFVVIDVGKRIFLPTVTTCGHILSNIIVILGLGAYLYSPRKLSIKSLRRAARNWTCCKQFKHYRQRGKKPSGIIDGDDLVSAEISVEQDIPSYTTALTTPYTNGFTDITEIVNSHRTTNYGTIQ
jgi:hypothetical protein